KVSGDQDEKSKFVGLTCGNSVSETSVQATSPTQILEETTIKEEDEGCKSWSNTSEHPQNKDGGPGDYCGDAGNSFSASGHHSSQGNKANRKTRIVM
ncbi:Two-component response regulator-like, partial [Sarracenia purpurea var. burkii]